MRILTYTFETSLRFSEPVSEHSFVLRCTPSSYGRQTALSTQTIVSPGVPLTTQHDSFGNALLIGRIPNEHDSFDYTASGFVMVDETCAPDECHPIFRRPSPRTQPDDAIRELAQDALGDVSLEEGPGAAWDTTLALSRALSDKMRYVPGSTDTSTSAAQALALGCGVCQDFSHALISLCRIRGIAARYVSGLVLGEGETHAWVEVHDGVTWRGVDPTHACAVDDTYIALARGRDFSDCPIEVGMFSGGARQEQSVSVRVVDQADQNDGRPHTIGSGTKRGERA